MVITTPKNNTMKKLFFFLIAFIPFWAWAQVDTLFDQAQFVTEPGAYNGYDISRLHPEHVSYGPGINFQHGYMMADDFTLDANATITEIEVYAYISYSPTTSPMTGLYFVIYDGNPMDGGQIIWGDLETNRMTTTEWTQCYRCGHSGSNPTNDERPIMSITASGLEIQLEAGKYYIAYGVTGDGEYGPYGIPVTIQDQLATGDALQYDGAGWWRELYMDQNYNCPAGAAFRLIGNTEPTHCEEISLAVIDIHPNPTQGQANIKANGMRHITVINLTGQVLLDLPISGDRYELNFSSFEAGTYLVRIATETGIGTKRLTVVR